MEDLPLVKEVLKYSKEDNISLCMPGHKAGIGFMSTDRGRELYESFIKCDITEVDSVDNLHNPKGVILEAQQLLSKYYESKKSYFLINGSTSGNLIMIFSCFNEGDKILVERNCHKSIQSAIILRKLRPIYIKNSVNSIYDAPMSIDMEHLIHILDSNKDARGIILTYPNYYGIGGDIEEIIYNCKKRGLKILVDSAHGAHFGAVKGLPESAVSLGADMVVMSAHKTLPSLNQAAFLHINNESHIEKVDFYVSAFLSTSPSYIILCSMDYARFFLEKEGVQAYTNLLKISKEYRHKINMLNNFHVLDENDGKNIDLTRYVINVHKNYNAYKVYDYFKKNKVQPEMCDGRNIILIFSPFNLVEDFETVYNILKSCPLDEMISEYKEVLDSNIPVMALEPYKVVDMEKQWVTLQDSIGRICAGSVIPYPPGVPILALGERVEEINIKHIKYYLKNNNNVIGIDNNKILVVWEENHD